MDRRAFSRLFGMLAVAMLVASGCGSMSPAYPVAQLEFDEALLGEWIPVRDPQMAQANAEPRGISRVSIEARSVEHNGTRVNPAWTLNLLDKDKPNPTLKQYRFIVSGENPEGPQRLQFEGYLIKFGERRLLGLQLEVAEEGGRTFAPLMPFLLPVHFVVRLDRVGDQLHIRLPKGATVGWIPLVKPLDLPTDAGSRRSIEGGGLYIAESVDRLLEHYASLAERDDAWESAKDDLMLKRNRP
jgi:hypothetical protein